MTELKYINKDLPDFLIEKGIQADPTFIPDKEFEKLINYQLSHYEKVEEITDTTGDYRLIYTPDIDDISHSKKEYTNYKDLWEDNFKKRFIDDFSDFTLEEIQENLNLEKTSDMLENLSRRHKEIAPYLKERQLLNNKERDLDNDGIPDRIDINDTRNAVQTTSDLSLVGNRTDKTSKQAERTMKR